MENGSFVLQRDHCTIEKAAIRHACALDDRFSVVASFSIGEISNKDANLSRACPVGTVEFCRAWMSAARINEPEPLDYPACLTDALRRSVRRTTFGQAADGAWVKPVVTKLWEPHVKGALPISDSDPVWECDAMPHGFLLAEWRVYVAHGQIVGDGRYDDGPDDTLKYDANLVASWVRRYTASGYAPLGYALDVALRADMSTMLIEVTDGWAIGLYKGSCRSVDYAELLFSRWTQIAS